MMREPGRYHHGDLARALADTGLAIARAEGAAGLSVRGIAKQLGVSPMAAYRHYPSADALLAVVSQRAREEFAQQIADRPDVAEGAPLDRLRALGAAYVEIALDDPELFSAAFLPVSIAPPRPDSPSGWELYRAVLPATDAATLQAQFTFAWSTVHGLAVLLGSGRYSDDERSARLASTLDLIESAIVHGPGGRAFDDRP
ncbi:TetR/AcrR family transcriptional regulator [Yonghaparkia sp. Soil809]|uniref:TetR/AcrR family transcriptional regulator n=1 Tax=Yonghaparkia sp. Soil809 TaxID=1736417 RepID=UPI0006FB5B6B|nr:TetR/AcrR family transcriptional regulator [Yonghaparkia sp. Soil809]KRF30775.1 hypothetical protein ASG83_07825 [Yonghaparkia sp. Soil809]